jgi:membrane protein implicated in regulation of membrane protease activity
MWIMVGLLLVGFEIVTGTFVALLLGVACILTAVVSYSGLVTSVTGQVALNAVLSLMSLILFRGQLKKFWGKKDKGSFEMDLGEFIILSASVPKGSESEISYQGTAWTAVNHSDHDFSKGDRVRILRSEGVKLIIGK